MPDPRYQLSAQELTYAATALRAEAHRAARQAADPQHQGSRVVFEDAAKVYGELAGKLDRIASTRTLARAMETRRGNWRQVILSGPYAIKVARPEADRAPGARCLNRWEFEMWTRWQPRFGWPHLCPVVWGEPEGHVLVMQRATQDATFEEIRTFEDKWMAENVLDLPGAESKPEDWGHLPDGRLVVCDYGYACDSEAEIERQRRDYAKQLRLRGR